MIIFLLWLLLGFWGFDHGLRVGLPCTEAALSLRFSPLAALWKLETLLLLDGPDKGPAVGFLEVLKCTELVYDRLSVEYR